MSQPNHYITVDISTNATMFEFTSVGPKGEIRKTVQFTPTRVEDVFNLAFGDAREDGSIDDSIINNNMDRDKILATVTKAVFDFTRRYPHIYVVFTGSTAERTRLYRMAITINLEELSRTFSLWGLTENNIFEPFKKRKPYIGFLAKRK